MIDEQKMEKLAFLIQESSDNNFSGDIIIRYYKGGITKVSKEPLAQEISLKS